MGSCSNIHFTIQSTFSFQAKEGCKTGARGQTLSAHRCCTKHLIHVKASCVYGVAVVQAALRYLNGRPTNPEEPLKRSTQIQRVDYHIVRKHVETKYQVMNNESV